MTFNPNAQLDPSQVDDERGRGIGGRGVAIGGGGLGLIIVLLGAPVYFVWRKSAK